MKMNTCIFLRPNHVLKEMQTYFGVNNIDQELGESLLPLMMLKTAFYWENWVLDDLITSSIAIALQKRLKL